MQNKHPYYCQEKFKSLTKTYTLKTRSQWSLNHPLIPKIDESGKNWKPNTNANYENKNTF